MTRLDPAEQTKARRTLRRVRNIPLETRRWRHDRFGRFVFIHINKTGGSSIERALSVPLEHYTALEKIDTIGQDAWQDRFTFTIVRNPFDRIVSHYEYRRTREHYTLTDEPLGFDDWIRKTLHERDPELRNQERMFIPQMRWITDASGAILVDEIFRFESLDAAALEIGRSLGTEVSLPHKKKSSRADDYRSYFTKESRGLVEAAYAEDLERLGYHFE